MKVTKLDTKTAGRFSIAAFLNARAQNIVNKSKFSARQQVQVERAHLVLGMLYNVEAYINFRKTLAAVKVPSHYSINPQLEQYEQDLEQAGWVKKISAQGTIYSIKKA